MARKNQTVEEQAPTVEEAVAAGLARLGLTEEWVDVEVVDEGRRGLLGIGGREAIVRLKVRAEARGQAQEVVETVVEKAPEAEAVVQPAAEEISEASQPIQPKPETVKRVREPQPPSEEELQETETAVAVVKELLDKMEVDATVESSISEPDDLTGRQITVINITGDSLGLMIGPRGETLDSFQHLTRLMVGHQIRHRANFVIDIDGYRDRREQALARMAERMGQKAIDRGTPVTLEPMPAYDRRIIHMTLRENPQVRTESAGEGNRRRVRIYPV